MYTVDLNKSHQIVTIQNYPSSQEGRMRLDYICVYIPSSQCLHLSAFKELQNKSNFFVLFCVACVSFLALIPTNIHPVDVVHCVAKKSKNRSRNEMT
jgi:hypothetical protein